ncbi:hypothetical protein ABZ805_28365, partial [Saccharopolyspora sp. NPDC047091]
MIERLLPGELAWEETRTDPPEAWLFDAEAAVIARAVDKRRCWCAPSCSPRWTGSTSGSSCSTRTWTWAGG